MKRLALDYAAPRKRRYTSGAPGGDPRFTRVSEQFLMRMETKLRVAIQQDIDNAPSKGVTLQ